MAEITGQRKGALVRGVLEILKEHPDGMAAKDVLKRLETVVPPTEFEETEYPKQPGVRRYEKIVRFGTIGPVKAGWMTKNKGTWTVSEDGKQALDRYQDPEALIRAADQLYWKWKKAWDAEQGSEAVEDSADSEAAATLEEAEEAAWTEIEEHLTTMGPYDFQDLVAGLLRGMGYHIGWIAPPGPDRGIDIIAHADPLGIEGARVKVQVKRRSDRLAVSEVRSFLAVLSDGDVGLFVSSGGFTRDCEDEARYQERRRVMLLDLKRFFDLWVEHYAKIPEEAKRLLPLKPVYFLMPEE